MRKNYKAGNFDIDGGINIDDFDWLHYFSGIAAACRGHFRPMISVDTKKLLALCAAYMKLRKDGKHEGDGTTPIDLSDGNCIGKESSELLPLREFDFGRIGEGDK